ncbi:unnamed protein product [Ciceribacter sp. T2.26MG-112.2]|nr:unnamed protein product [Ciceribacter naphthalenivorans]
MILDGCLGATAPLLPDGGEEWSAQPTKRSSESFRMTNALSKSEGPAEVARRAG